MNSNTEARLIELEIRMAHYERMAEELSTVLTEQGKTVELLTRQVRHLKDRVRDLEAGWERSPQDDKPPPHW